MPKLPKVTNVSGCGFARRGQRMALSVDNLRQKAVCDDEVGRQSPSCNFSLPAALGVFYSPFLLCFACHLLVLMSSIVVGQGTDDDFESSAAATKTVTPVPELPATLSNNSSDVSRPPSTETGDSRGNQLMQEASEQLAAHRSIKAGIRQRVELFGHTLVGSGEYHQLRSDQSLLLRTDLKIQLQDRFAIFQQIVDGKFLWKYQDSPDIEELGKFRKQLSRVDLDAVRMAVPATVESAAMKSRFKPGLDHGGLPRLMKQITTHFDFGPPQPSTLYDTAVWTVVGNWNPKALESISRVESEDDRPKPRFEYDRAIEKLPPYMPQTITIALGQADLFPHRIEYRRRTADAQSQNEIVITRRSKPILILELLEVQVGGAIDPNNFVRLAGNLPVVDATEKYLRENGLSRLTN